MSVIGWILAGILGIAYIVAGGMKLTTPRDKLLTQPNMGWVEDVTATQLRAIGAIEVVGGLGVLLPWLTDIAPILTPIAALGLAAVQVCAIALHMRRKETKALPVNLVLLVLALVVAAIRFSQL